MKKYVILLNLLAILSSCESYLDVKPRKSIDTPNSFEAVRALLDNAESLNTFPTQSVVLGDEFFADEQGITGMDLLERNFYLWLPDPFQPDDLVFDWRDCYNQIQIANIALETLDELPTTNQEWSVLRGTALFFRAHAYFNLYSLFLDGPNLETKGLTLQIPIRTNTSIVLKPQLAGKETIREMILKDLTDATTLLPQKVEFLSRPSQQAAFALLARANLSWEDYAAASEAAQEAIRLGGTLMDFNTLRSSATYPVPAFNSEIIWLAQVGGTSYFNSQNAFQISVELLGLHSSQDLRRTLFYVRRANGLINFRGSYLSGRPLFGGLSLNEMYLVHAESLVRLGRVPEAETVLEVLLKNRMNPSWQGLTFATETDALRQIIDERRKELPFRGLRWTDLRRLNKDPRFQVTLNRRFSGSTYTLTPDSENYVVPIPARELGFY